MEVSKGEISRESASLKKNSSVAKSTLSLCEKAYELCQMHTDRPLLEIDILSIVEDYFWEAVDIRQGVKNRNAPTGGTSGEIANPSTNEDVYGIDPMEAVRGASSRLGKMSDILSSLIVVKKLSIDAFNQVLGR